ncbi:uncharacterized protein LOC129606483 [Condylostylus longicornis]|uniref:uncharacterized protein LOC129606483 n=1 Tax=Condylostylus longicornis TaxID=2530218 RepID=UPI00244E078F|nr:uncharacterized protein LOC129606483 [Condylostylus longicornis]
MYMGRNLNAKHNKPFKHVGPLNYTEDDILIYTLYICGPIKKTDKNNLERYFSKFGQLENVKIITKKSSSSKSGSFNFAFVNFKEAESASKALRCKHHYLGSGILTVKSADSYNQPFQKKLQEPDIESSDNEESNINYSILNLNDDCMLIMFKYLSFSDHIKMSVHGWTIYSN